MKDSLLKSFKNTTQFTGSSKIVGGTGGAKSEPNPVDDMYITYPDGRTLYITSWEGSDGTVYTDSCTD